MKRIFAMVMLLVFVALPLVAVGEESVNVKPTIDLTAIIISVIGLVFNAVLVWLGKSVIPNVKQWLDAKTNKEQRELLYEVIAQTVESAEQLIGSGAGDAKRKYVVDTLMQKGFTVDIDMIEAAVKQMNDRGLKGFREMLNVGKEEDSEE